MIPFTAKIRNLINEAEKQNIHILSIELRASDYKVLRDSFMESSPYATDSYTDDLTYRGVTLKRKGCICGAYPEDTK